MAARSRTGQALTRAAAANTKLVTITLDGPGSELNFREMRGAHALNLAHKRLRLVSGTIIGAVAGMNRGLHDLNLESNELGPGGSNAIVMGINARPGGVALPCRRTWKRSAALAVARGNRARTLSRGTLTPSSIVPHRPCMPPGW